MATGTDEHGMKIQRAANAAQQNPKDFCDAAAEIFMNLAHEANISNDHFIRTTDQSHREAVHYAWHMLSERNYIYTSKHEGWYSVSDETFYPESAIEPRIDPATGRKNMYSMETGKIVEFTSELNYHFRLSAFRDRLISLYKDENPNFVLPQMRHAYILQQLVSQPLADLSISRPSERLTWGIPVPHDKSQTIYVWLDALINYLTVAGYPFIPGLESAGGWPADVHVIGKDILRFHCIYWPAFLMALDLPLPKNILTHAHWTMNKRKMSKSDGNVVSPTLALSRFGVDTMRLYLIHDGGLMDDGDYSNEQVIERYSKLLQGQLGNLLSRVSSKNFDVGDAVLGGAGRPWAQAADGNHFTIPGNIGLGQPEWNLTEDDQLQIAALFSLPLQAIEMIENRYDVPGALKEIMKIILQTNKYISEAEPWKMAKALNELPVELGGSEIQKLEQELRKVIYLCAEGLRVAGIMLQPFMPEKAPELLNRLRVRGDKRGIEWALKVGGDMEYGQDMTKSKFVLFPPLEVYE